MPLKVSDALISCDVLRDSYTDVRSLLTPKFTPAAFAYDEFGEFRDAGSLFYATDFWSLWDVGIIGVGTAYLTLRESIASKIWFRPSRASLAV